MGFVGDLVGDAFGFVGDAVGAVTGANQAKDIAKEQAQAQADAARVAAGSSVFRPVGVTSQFGTSAFTYEKDPETGFDRVASGSYALSPEYQALQNAIKGNLGTMLGLGLDTGYIRDASNAAAAQQYMTGMGYIGQNPQEVAQRYVNNQMALLEPGRAREEDRLENSLFSRGRLGLNLNSTGGSPELFALSQARAEQDQAIAARAEQEARQQIAFGNQLVREAADTTGNIFSLQQQALAPYLQQLQAVAGLDALGQDSLRLGLQLGGLATDSASQAGQLLGSGLQSAANTRAAGAQAKNASTGQFINSAIGALLGGF